MTQNIEKSLDTDPRGQPTVCANCAVRNSSLCGALTADEIADLNVLSHRKSLEPGQIHVFEGDRALDFANVTGGVAKLMRGAEDGREQIVGLLFPSDFIGGPMNETHPDEPYTIEAVSPLDLCIFPREGFEALLSRYPALERKLLDRTLSELQLAREWMVLLGRKTAKERVATFILHVAEKMRNRVCQGAIAFDLPLGRADIADHIGLTIETVSRQITQLRKDGVIDMKGSRHIVSYDAARLRDCAGF